MRTLSSLALLVLSFADAAPAPNTPRASAIDRRRQLLATSTTECELGSDGVLVELDTTVAMGSLRSRGASPVENLLGKIEGCPGSRDVMYKLPSINTVAAHLSDSGVEALLKDPEVKSITA